MNPAPRIVLIAAGTTIVLLCLHACKSGDSVKKDTAGPAEVVVVEEQEPVDFTVSPDPLTLSVMRAKLLHSHMLLEAVTLKDFARIEQNAAALKSLSEESDWHVHATLSYRIFSEQFQDSAEALEIHAQQRNIDAVARDYAQLTSSCFDCHTYLRREGLVKDLPGAVSWRPRRRSAFGG